MKGEDMGADKEWFEIIMKQANGNLMTALENQIQADIGGTREQANRVANHILDILDNIKEISEQEIRNKVIDELQEAICDSLDEKSIVAHFGEGIKADIVTLDCVVDIVFEIAEKMRGAEKNIKLIMDMPKAYDVSEVVKQIQDKYCHKCRNILGKRDSEEYCKSVKCEIDALCNIVKAGGVE